MKKIKIITITLEGTLSINEMRKFRAAIARHAGENNILFHHHLDNKRLLYRYPLIQFKSIKGKPIVVGLEEGAEAMLRLFKKELPELQFPGKKFPLVVERLRLSKHPLQVWNQLSAFYIENWLAMNKKNFEKYLHTDSLVERTQMLERILIAHILAFAEGVGWNVDKPIRLSIQQLHKQHWLAYKGIKWLALDISFKTNVSLPNGIGLGKSPSIGFGVVRKISASNK